MSKVGKAASEKAQQAAKDVREAESSLALKDMQWVLSSHAGRRTMRRIVLATEYFSRGTRVVATASGTHSLHTGVIEGKREIGEAIMDLVSAADHSVARDIAADAMTHNFTPREGWKGDDDGLVEIDDDPDGA